mgnify:CR=1 FL=1
MSVIDEAVKFVRENSFIEYTDYYTKRLRRYVRETTGIRITQKEARYLIKQLTKKKEIDKL